MRFIIVSLAIILAVQATTTYARAHKHHKRSLGLFDLDKPVPCIDHSYCEKYSTMDCASSFLQLNCKKLCGLCEDKTKKVNLPLVLYYNKHKGQRQARSAQSDYKNIPMWSKTLFNYTGPIQNWNFNFVKHDQHPIKMDWSKPQPFAKPADNAQTNDASQNANADKQQTNDASQQKAQPQQQQTADNGQQQQQTGYNGQQQQNAYNGQQQSSFQPQTAAPQAPAQQPADQQQQQQTQQQDVPAFRIPAKAFNLADQGKDVYINVPQTQQANDVMNQAMNDQPTKANDDGPIQSFNYKPVKVPCPKGQECNYKGPNAPQINETFMVYCDDKFPNCGVLFSSCNESWLQVYCPKRCGICKPNDSAQGAQPQAIDTNEGNKVYPSNVSELNDDPNVNIQSELVAPEPSDKPQRARYTLHVTPKLKNGVPQTQQIFIMPPNAKPGGNIKPLVILKQKVTKAMVENIEIDVPPKGVEYSDEPKVEVIEGSQHETLKVSEGKADLTKAEADLSAAAAPAAAQTAPAPAAAQTAAAPAAAPAAAQPAAAPAAAAETPAPAPAQDYQATQAAAPAAPAAETPAAPAPAADYSTPAAAAAPAAAPAADNSQYSQTQSYTDNTQAQTADQTAQTQSYQQQNQQSYDQSQQAAAPTQAPTAAPAAYPQQQQTYQDQTSQCVDDNRCASYTTDMCTQSWMQTNCKHMCNLC